jgi:hypothetical protein
MKQSTTTIVSQDDVILFDNETTQQQQKQQQLLSRPIFANLFLFLCKFLRRRAGQPLITFASGIHRSACRLSRALLWRTEESNRKERRKTDEGEDANVCEDSE